MSSSAFLLQPNTISFAKERAVFKFDFNTSSMPVRVKCALFDQVNWNFPITIKVNSQSYAFTASSASELSDKVSASEAKSLIAVTYDSSFFYVTALDLSVHELLLGTGWYSFKGGLNSNISSSVDLKVNDNIISNIQVAEIDGNYTVDVSDLLPARLPSIPAVSGIIDYPHKYQVVPHLSGAGEFPESDVCYSFGVSRPVSKRDEVDWNSPLNQLDELPVGANQRVFVHYLCNDTSTYSLQLSKITNSGVTITNTSSIGGVVNKVLSFVVTMPSEECILQVQVLKNGMELVGKVLSYHIMPPAERTRYMYIQNLFGLYESILILQPASSGFEFDSDQLKLNDESISIKNTNVSQVNDLTIDMLDIRNAAFVSCFLSTHGQFILEQDSTQYKCILSSKNLDAIDESTFLQPIKIKYKVG